MKKKRREVFKPIVLRSNANQLLSETEMKIALSVSTILRLISAKAQIIHGTSGIYRNLQKVNGWHTV